MTELYYTRNDGQHELYVTGHAGYDAEGRDIVCSAISAVGYTLLGYLANCDEEPDFSYIDEPGRLVVICEITPKTNTAFEMAYIGLSQIAQQYPPFVRFIDPQ